MFRKLRNKIKFKDYQQRLISAVKDDAHIQFLIDNGNPFRYYTDFPSADIPFEIKLSHHYYDEIQISKIIGVNAKKITDENFSRVIGAVDYILNNQCKPIEVVKLKNGYYVLDGKHRLFAHILLRKDTIPVSVRQPCTEIIEKTYPLISISRSFYISGGVDFEEIFSFIKTYTSSHVKISQIKYDKYEKLLTIKLGNDTMEIKGAFSGVGRSNLILCELLEELDFRIDLKYIEERDNFVLYNAYSANHISYSTIKRDKQLIDNLIRTKNNWVWNSGNEIELLLGYIGELMKTNYVPCNFYWSNMLNNKMYYCLGCNIKGENEQIYLFEGSTSFDNLSIELIDIISENEEQYSKIRW